MRFLPTSVHALLDYLVGTLLIVAPWVLDFAENRPATYVPVALGAAAVIYSLLTAYEGGAAKLLPMKTHLTFDFLSGVFLAASPWLLGFSDTVYLPHLILGLFEIGAALVTQTKPRMPLPGRASGAPTGRALR